MHSIQSFKLSKIFQTRQFVANSNINFKFNMSQLLDLNEPDSEGKGWTIKTKPEVSAVSDYEFNFLVIATGRQVPTRPKT